MKCRVRALGQGYGGLVYDVDTAGDAACLYVKDVYGSDVDSYVAVEVLTPDGTWSSFTVAVKVTYTAEETPRPPGENPPSSPGVVHAVSTGDGR